MLDYILSYTSPIITLSYFWFCLVTTKMTYKRCLCLSFVWNFSVKNKIIKSYCASRYVVYDSTRLYRQFSIRNSTPLGPMFENQNPETLLRNSIRCMTILYKNKRHKIINSCAKAHDTRKIMKNERKLPSIKTNILAKNYKNRSKHSWVIVRWTDEQTDGQTAVYHNTSVKTDV